MAKRVCGYACVAGCIMWAGVVRFDHPALTETQLFLAYWPTWIAIGIVAAFGAFLVRKGL